MITSRHRLRALTAASGLAALAFLGAACGGDSGGDGKAGASGNGSGSGSGAASTGRGGSGGAPSMDQQLKLARCMRGQGVNMPDPKPGQESQALSIDGQGASPQKIEKAMKTCRNVAGIPEPKPISQEEKDKMLKFARCMREHGIDMPDPKFGSGSASSEAVGIPGGGIAKEKFEKANKACGAAFG
ncbi:hypothetical protein SMC26_19870 [Actinomadura fulvescens]|uniref:Lipoprotein n=1 Tax=Actinomadura fulvescens TaxID=46160 RepID=A0ABN3PS01_9ACTN